MLADMVNAASRGEIGGELKAGDVVLDEMVAELVGRLVSGDKTVGEMLSNVIIHSGEPLHFHYYLNAPLTIVNHLQSILSLPTHPSRRSTRFYLISRRRARC